MNVCPTEKKNRKIAASGKKVYNCEYCDAGFNSISGLTRHRTTKHADEYSPPTILCPICRETVRSHRELAEHAHQQHAEDSDDFVVETVAFQNVEDYQVTERIDGVTVEHCLTHLGHEGRPSQLRLDESAEKNLAAKCRVQPGRLHNFDTVSIHAALLYAAAGRRSQQNCGLSLSSAEGEEADSVQDALYSSDGDEEMMEAAVDDEVESAVGVGAEETLRSSTDIQDGNRDLLQRIEMEMALIRENVIKMMRRPTEGAQMSMEQTLRNLEQLRKTTDSLADNAEGNDQNMRLARRADVPPVGRPQAPTPIRKLQKRAHLRKEEQGKRRKPLLEIPDCAHDERDACAVCLRMQPSNSTNNQICWIQCPTCEDWMHTECISNNVCPHDGTELDSSDADFCKVNLSAPFCVLVAIFVHSKTAMFIDTLYALEDGVVIEPSRAEGLAIHSGFNLIAVGTRKLISVHTQYFEDKYIETALFLVLAAPMILAPCSLLSESLVLSNT
ncbi:hypothetical protein RB195_024919 [Necator americanus]|uniref:C2H2-type domain-containing protein n=1 Tax=Necator americanus TaxID=51031 RepID=A0ABR1EQ38_NECAM